MSLFRSSSTPPSLHRAWGTTVAKLVAIIASVGLLAVVSTQYQRTLFTSTTADLLATTEAMVDLDRRFVEITAPTIGVLYRSSNDEERFAHAIETYGEARVELLAAFDQAIEVLGTGAVGTKLADERRNWEAIDAVIMSSMEDYTDEELWEAVEGSEDPFVTTVWGPVDEVKLQVAAVRGASVTELIDQVAAADRSQQLIGPVVVGALLLALLFALLATRRISRQVLVPLSAVGRGAQAMDQRDEGHTVEVPGAVAEVQELARIINATAASLRTHHAALRTQARTDSMTTLPNRDAFTESLHAMLDEPSVSCVSVLFVDLDDFKDVNDTLGHAAGDELLRIVAERLKAATRGCDIAARLGGDEFAVALDAGDDQVAPVVVAERIRLALSEPVDIAGHMVEVSCSIGIVVSDPDVSSAAADELLGSADFAMYMAKSQGKGRFELYSPSMHTEMSARMELGRDLTVALAMDQFLLHYQPVLDVHTEELLGFESLIRWQHPDRGLVPPNDFIGLAEDSGAIIDIGKWVLDQACATLVRLQVHDPELTIGVNVSPQQLIGSDFAETVMEIIRRHGITPDRLVLEITEATAMTNTDEGAAALSILREHGVHVALDDFGTGYSSLQHLGDLPVDFLKIDRAFVTSASVQAESTLRSIVELARSLGLGVVAEGIEEPDQLERLRRLGPMLGQGYLLARPMPEEQALQFLRQSVPSV